MNKSQFFTLRIIKYNEMNTQHLENLVNKIWKSYIHRPTRKETAPFDKELEDIDIKKFIIYNFLHHQGTSLRELLLSTFKFWKHLNYQQWQQIFDRLRENNLAEYYLAVIANQYLDIDPKFKSTENVEIVHYTTADERQQSGKPSLFVGNMQGELRVMEEEELDEDFGLTIDDFLALSNRLNSEIL